MDEPRYQHVMVPTNFSPECREAYRTAFAAARSSNAAVTLFHVLPRATEEDYSGLDAFVLLHRAAERKSGTAEMTSEQASTERVKTIERMRSEIPPEWVGTLDFRMEVARGNASNEIARYARTAGVDLIVVGGSRPGMLPSLSRNFADRLALATPVKIVRVLPPL